MTGFVSALPLAGFVGCLAVAAISDARALRIPNIYNAMTLILFGVHALLNLTPEAAATALAMGGVTLVLGYLAHEARLMGGGDAKLFAACMSWAGPANGLEFLAVTSLAGGAVALALMSPFTARLTLALQQGWPAAACDGARAPMPYGVAIAAGGLFVAYRIFIS